MIRGKCTDLAVLDCAYGKDNKSFSEYSNKFISFIRRKKSQSTTLMLPIPKYGRGLEIYWLLKENFPEWKYAADRHFIQELNKTEGSFWIRGSVNLSKNIMLYDTQLDADVVFVSDPQLRSSEAKEIAAQVLEKGHGIMTGTVEKGTLSERLIQEKKMTMIRFPVHLNYAQFRKVASYNSFGRIIAYHTPMYECVKEIDL